MEHTHVSLRVDPHERGAALPIVLFVTMSVGALSMAHLTMVVSENKSVRTEMYAARAQAEADAQLEMAKNIINASPYDDGVNNALAAAVAADPPFVPGTTVLAESLGGDWYSIHALGSYQGNSRRAQAFVRTRTPLTSYNYFVTEQKLGISGAPRGRIHSNDRIEFYFPWGTYQDEISAVNGFDFKVGATATNTHFLGQWNDHADTRELLADSTITDLAAKADTMKIDDDGLIAEVEFQGVETEVRLYIPEHSIQVPRETTQKVFDHYQLADVPTLVAVYRDEIVQTVVPVYQTQPVTVSVTVPVYENQQVTTTVQVPIYETQAVTRQVSTPVYATREVQRSETRQRWVEDPPPSGDGEATGTDISGAVAIPGHWETYTVMVTTTESYVDHYNITEVTENKQVQVGVQDQQVTKTVKVKVGTTVQQVTQNQQVQVGTTTVSSTRRVFDHYDIVVVQKQVPIYVDVPVTVYDTVIVPEELVETRTVPTSGIVYIAGAIRSVSGQVDGRLTLVTNSTARITDSIQYVDADRNTRMLNGTDPHQRYESNPDYQGRSALAILATNDIRYAVEAPSRLEINASLISLDGMVGFDGLTVADDGTSVTFTPASGHPVSHYQKDLIRRLGGIVSRKRPISTHIDAYNQLIAGFARGSSMMDRKLMIEIGGAAVTQGGLEQNQPTWTLQAAGRDLAMEH